MMAVHRPSLDFSSTVYFVLDLVNDLLLLGLHPNDKKLVIELCIDFGMGALTPQLFMPPKITQYCDVSLFGRHVPHSLCASCIHILAQKKGAGRERRWVRLGRARWVRLGWPPEKVGQIGQVVRWSDGQMVRWTLPDPT